MDWSRYKGKASDKHCHCSLLGCGSFNRSRLVDEMISAVLLHLKTKGLNPNPRVFHSQSGEQKAEIEKDHVEMV